MKSICKESGDSSRNVFNIINEGKDSAIHSYLLGRKEGRREEERKREKNRQVEAVSTQIEECSLSCLYSCRVSKMQVILL